MLALDVRSGVFAGVFCYLLLAMHWVTPRVLGPSRRQPPLVTGAAAPHHVRWGATAGVVFWLGLVAFWNIVTVIQLLFPEPENIEYNLIGGRYAVFVISAIVLVPIGLIAASVGAVVGGVIAVIDRVFVMTAHWIFRSR